MTSTASWLDFDLAAQRRAYELIDAFREPGTIDELGIGTVRDTFSGFFFPGVSTLHTRARYFLFIPRLFAAAAKEPTLETAKQSLRRLEVRLIRSLLDGVGTDRFSGVIGRNAKENLKITPASMYWASLRRYGMVQRNGSITTLLRWQVSANRALASQDHSDGASVELVRSVVDPELLRLPIPNDWLTSTTFRMSPAEASYLRDHIIEASPGSLYALILRSELRPTELQVWEQPWTEALPGSLLRTVAYAQQFSELIHGASIMYNLMLAELEHRTEPIDSLRQQLDDWQTEVTHRPGWDRDGFWRAVRTIAPRLSGQTQAFIDAWCTRAPGTPHLATDPAMQGLIQQREVAVKGARARLTNRRAREGMGEIAFGMGRLDFNWAYARRVVTDIAEGVGAHGSNS